MFHKIPLILMASTNGLPCLHVLKNTIGGKECNITIQCFCKMTNRNKVQLKVKNMKYKRQWHRRGTVRIGDCGRSHRQYVPCLC